MLTASYHHLYEKYRSLKEQNMQERAELHQEIEEVDMSLGAEEEEKRRLQGLREGLYDQIEQLREELN